MLPHKFIIKASVIFLLLLYSGFLYVFVFYKVSFYRELWFFSMMDLF